GASLLVALVLAPLATRYLEGGRIRTDPGWLLWLRGAYARLLDATLRRPADASLVLLLALAFTATVAIPGVPFADASGGGLNDFMVRFHVPRDATYEERDVIAHAFEEMFEEHGADWGVRVYRLELGGRSSRGRVFVYLESDGPMARADVVEAVKAALPTELPGVTSYVGWDSQGGGDKQLELSIYGEDMDTLERLAEEAVRRVKGLPGVLGAALDLDERGLEEIRLLPDEDALRRYGLDARTVATTVAFALRGNRLTPLRLGEAEIDVETRLSLEDRSDLERVLDFPVFAPASAGLVPLRAVTDVEFGQGPGTIRRRGRRTSLDITVDLGDDVSKEALTP
ncbi:MAG: efflux RND transporter permease subunit, partial [Myxococcales bacterium]|nr:efflux RND transporter permease subunit [Myxococcales bacterium]